MSLLNALFNSYTISQLGKILINALGPTAIVVIILAILGLFSYTASIPVNSAYMGYDRRILAREFLGNFMYFLFTVTAILILLDNPSQLIWMIVFCAPLLLLFIYNSSWFGKKWNFEDYDKFHSREGNSNWVRMLIDKRFLGIPLMIVAVVIEFYIIAEYEPSIALITWVFVIYIFFLLLMFIALAWGITKRLTASTKITLKDIDNNTFECYLIARSPDHYLVVAKDRMMAIHPNAIKEIIFETYDTKKEDG